MSRLSLTRLLPTVAIFVALAAPALGSVSKLESLGDNTFAITRTATTGFDRDVAKFRQEAEQDAARYCAEKGKVVKVLTATSNRPHFGGGYASAKVIFKALDAGDPLLTAPEPGSAAVANSSVAAPGGVLPTFAGDFYTEMLKLEDLRKRGLLSDKEFDQQKKKLIKRSK